MVGGLPSFLERCCHVPRPGMDSSRLSPPLHGRIRLLRLWCLLGAWLRGDWQPHQCLPLRSKQWQELFAIVTAASTWGHHWSGQQIYFHCDNLPIVQAWVRQSSKHPDLMQLLRTLFLVSPAQFHHPHVPPTWPTQPNC